MGLLRGSARLGGAARRRQSGWPRIAGKFYVRLPDHDTTLSPTWAVAELGGGDTAWQLLVRIEAPGIDPDARGALEGWEATPHQRFERLLRDSGVFAGLLITEKKEERMARTGTRPSCGLSTRHQARPRAT